MYVYIYIYIYIYILQLVTANSHAASLPLHAALVELSIPVFTDTLLFVTWSAAVCRT